MSERHELHRHDAPVAPIEARVDALESLLIEKGVLDSAAIDSVIEHYEHEVGPMNGARVVARAWSDAAYKARLLDDGKTAIAELGFGGSEGNLVVLENTPTVHNVVVCTLCSCYPWPVLGIPPNWYKSPPYRARMVREPRILLEEMGCSIADEVEIRVWDSSAEMRYMILPVRPEAATADLTESDLTLLVTRDSMIGVARL
jgi:nitrile hydratase subunit alpha